MWSPSAEPRAALGSASAANPLEPFVSTAALTEITSPATATLPSSTANAACGPLPLLNSVSVAPLYAAVAVLAPALLKALSNQACAPA